MIKRCILAQKRDFSHNLVILKVLLILVLANISRHKTDSRDSEKDVNKTLVGSVVTIL